MSTDHVEGQQPAQPLEEWFLELLACPACTRHWSVRLNEAGDALLCRCGRYSFPVREGIPVLLVEEATLIDANAHPEDVVENPSK